MSDQTVSSSNVSFIDNIVASSSKATVCKSQGKLSTASCETIQSCDLWLDFMGVFNTSSEVKLPLEQQKETFYPKIEGFSDTSTSLCSVSGGKQSSYASCDQSLLENSRLNSSVKPCSSADSISDVVHCPTPIKRQRSNDLGNEAEGNKESPNISPTMIDLTHFTWDDSNSVPGSLIQNQTPDLRRPVVTKKEIEIIDVDEVTKHFESEAREEVSRFGPSEFKLTISLLKNDCDGTNSTPNAEWMYVGENGLELAFNRNTSLLFEHLYNTSSKLNSTVRTRLPETGREYEINLNAMKMMDVSTKEEISLFRKTWMPDVLHEIGSGSSMFPAFWSPQEADIELVDLDRTTREYMMIRNTFLHTLPDRHVLHINRVQNKKLYIRYAFQKALLMDKYSGNDQKLNEKLLFHGTKQTPPSQIWESEDGFDLRYCRHGMWGIGTYFAVKASYSDNYAYNYHDVVREMFVANVLTGNSMEMRPGRIARKLTRPPVSVPATATTPEVLYDSVTGITNGSRVYVLYKLDMAYPSYLVRYS